MKLFVFILCSVLLAGAYCSFISGNIEEKKSIRIDYIKYDAFRDFLFRALDIPESGSSNSWSPLDVGVSRFSLQDIDEKYREDLVSEFLLLAQDPGGAEKVKFSSLARQASCRVEYDPSGVPKAILCYISHSIPTSAKN